MNNLEKFRNIKYTTRTACVCCGSKFSKSAIELPDFPITEVYTDTKINERIGYVDQAFHLCEKCGLGQLSNIVDPEVIYGESYFTRTSTSPSAVEALEIFIEFINSIIGDRDIDNIIEVGCNDLFLLEQFKDRADKLFGIDPIFKGIENEVNDEKINVIGDFAENVKFTDLTEKVDIVLCSHTLEHIEEPIKLVKNLLDNSDEDTLHFFQFPSLELLVKYARYDQLFHEHLNYFSLKSIKYFLKELSAELVSYKFNTEHFGTIMICFKKKGGKFLKFDIEESVTENITYENVINQYQLFKDMMQSTNKRLESLSNEKIYGFGAALMLPVQYYYMPALSSIESIIDDDIKKDGKYYLNFPKPVKHPKHINDIGESIVIITAISSRLAIRAITRKLIELKVNEIIVPTNTI